MAHILSVLVFVHRYIRIIYKYILLLNRNHHSIVLPFLSICECFTIFYLCCLALSFETGTFSVIYAPWMCQSEIRMRESIGKIYTECTTSSCLYRFSVSVQNSGVILSGNFIDLTTIISKTWWHCLSQICTSFVIVFISDTLYDNKTSTNHRLFQMCFFYWN